MRHFISRMTRGFVRKPPITQPLFTAKPGERELEVALHDRTVRFETKPSDPFLPLWAVGDDARSVGQVGNAEAAAENAGKLRGRDSVALHQGVLERVPVFQVGQKLTKCRFAVTDQEPDDLFGRGAGIGIGASGTKKPAERTLG